MTDLSFKRAYDSIEVDLDAKERIYSALCDASEEKEAAMNVKHRSYKKTFLILAAAIALLTALAVSSFADEIFGVKAILVETPSPAPTEETTVESTVDEMPAPEFDVISASQPQAVPEGITPEIAEKVANSEKAWAEWRACLDVMVIKDAPIFTDFPEDAYRCELEETDDGGCIIKYMGADWNEETNNYTIAVRGEAKASAEEYEQHKLWEDDQMKRLEARPKYDFRYGAVYDEENAKLEEIAEKYGLKLRGEQKNAWSSETTGQTGANFYTNDECAALTAEMGTQGNIFRETPQGFDKLYWYDEGTFCVSFYYARPSDGESMSVYIYNSPYGTLSSGMESVSTTQAADSFAVSYHRTPEGIELTVLSGDKEAYAYAYLENSFVTIHLSTIHLNSDIPMTEDDIFAALDAVNYSLIN